MFCNVSLLFSEENNIPSQCTAEAAFLRHRRTNFENDAAKTVPAAHLAHTDFWPVAGLCILLKDNEILHAL